MKNTSAFLALVLTAAPLAAQEATALRHPPRTAAALPQPAPVAPAVAALPPLPAGIEELKFADFFKTPVGPAGLELTDKIRALDGHRVRILGHMVTEEVTKCSGDDAPTVRGRKLPVWTECLTPGRLLLTPRPAEVSYAHYGICDDLPPQTLYVTVPEKFGEPVPHTPGLLLLTGTLSVGNKPEPDGRISTVRLTLDPLAKPDAAKLAGPSLSVSQSTKPTNTR